MECGQKGNNEGPRGLLIWLSCALESAVISLRGLEKKITVAFQRYAILDA